MASAAEVAARGVPDGTASRATAVAPSCAPGRSCSWARNPPGTMGRVSECVTTQARAGG
jgi:hypothetical protein